ncbi:MAG: ester cyclase [Flavobacteriaceae bacterium]
MTLEENKALVISFFKKANHYKKTPKEMCTKDFIAHIVGSKTFNLQAFESYQTNYYSSFSNTRTVIEDLIAEGDRVAFMGVPAKGKQIIVPIFGFAKIINGKISEWWNSPDRLSWMQQIGALPKSSKVKKSKIFPKRKI